MWKHDRWMGGWIILISIWNFCGMICLHVVRKLGDFVWWQSGIFSFNSIVYVVYMCLINLYNRPQIWANAYHISGGHNTQSVATMICVCDYLFSYVRVCVHMCHTPVAHQLEQSWCSRERSGVRVPPEEYNFPLYKMSSVSKTLFTLEMGVYM